MGCAYLNIIKYLGYGLSAFEPVLGTLMFLLDALASMWIIGFLLAGNVTTVGTLLRPNASLLVILVAVSTLSRPKNLGT